jgi:selenide,water dikinase
MLRRAEVALLGGHTVQDQEIKFGYAVTGEVHPKRIWANGGARAGDVLFLTKPLGTGIIATALKAGRAPQGVVQGAVNSMLRLNRGAADALRSLPPDAVHACTDVTGFGLVGHACEMSAASDATLEIRAAGVPLFDGVLDLVAEHLPGGARTNAQHFGQHVRFGAELDGDVVKVLHDPQTSGGLLVAIADAHAIGAEQALGSAGVEAWRIGRVIPAAGCHILLI